MTAGILIESCTVQASSSKDIVNRLLKMNVTCHPV